MPSSSAKQTSKRSKKEKQMEECIDDDCDATNIKRSKRPKKLRQQQASSSAEAAVGEGGGGETPEKREGELEECEFHDYACAKTFDILSKGMYKKFLAQSRIDGEEWACKVVQSVTRVQQVVSCIHQLIQEMAVWEGRKMPINLSALSEACIEVMDAAVPPKKRKHTSSVCCITGIHLPAEEGVEIMKRKDHSSFLSIASSLPKEEGEEDHEDEEEEEEEEQQVSMHPKGRGGLKRKRSEAGRNVDNGSSYQEIVVHPRFMHFFNMLWFVCRIDHVLRNIAKGWMASTNSGAEKQRQRKKVQAHSQAKKSTLNEDESAACSQIALMQSMRQEEENQAEGIGLCQKFADQNAETIASMGIMFRHASRHVYNSLSRMSTTSPQGT